MMMLSPHQDGMDSEEEEEEEESPVEFLARKHACILLRSTHPHHVWKRARGNAE